MKSKYSRSGVQPVTVRYTHMEVWCDVFTKLHRMGQLRREEPDSGGWFEMNCPWGHHHSAAICEPHEENGYIGAFRCSHCVDRRWADLIGWLEKQERLVLLRAGGAA